MKKQLAYTIQVWGVTIGGAVLQNGLKKRIPSTILDQIPGKGASVVYAAIPLLPNLPAEHRRIIEIAFAKSMQDVWKVMTGIAALGLLVSLPMKALKLHTELDDDDAYIIEEGMYQFHFPSHLEKADILQ
jgi:hypothetical protein